MLGYSNIIQSLDEGGNIYVIKYINKNDFLCLKILKGDERLAKELTRRKSILQRSRRRRSIRRLGLAGIYTIFIFLIT